MRNDLPTPDELHDAYAQFRLFDFSTPFNPEDELQRFRAAVHQDDMIGTAFWGQRLLHFLCGSSGMVLKHQHDDGVSTGHTFWLQFWHDQLARCVGNPFAVFKDDGQGPAPKG